MKKWRKKRKAMSTPQAQVGKKARFEENEEEKDIEAAEEKQDFSMKKEMKTHVRKKC